MSVNTPETREKKGQGSALRTAQRSWWPDFVCVVSGMRAPVIHVQPGVHRRRSRGGFGWGYGDVLCVWKEDMEECHNQYNMSWGGKRWGERIVEWWTLEEYWRIISSTPPYFCCLTLCTQNKMSVYLRQYAIDCMSTHRLVRKVFVQVFSGTHLINSMCYWNRATGA